ncbi:hypothetical protein X975_02969, partial [Stegodyphus mimosarum]
MEIAMPTKSFMSFVVVWILVADIICLADVALPTTPKEEHESFIPEKNSASGRKSNSAIAILFGIGICATLLLIVIIIFIIVFAKCTWKKKTAISGAVSPYNVLLNDIPQNVFSNIPVQPQQLSANNLPTAVNIPQVPNPESRPSVFDQVRKDIDSIINLLRRQKHSKPGKLPEENDRKETYQVPPMYPNLDQMPSAPELNGTINPDFKNEEGVE